MRVGDLKKAPADVKAYIYLCIEISARIYQELTKKTRSTAFATKVVEKAFFGAPLFSATNRFWVDVGGPAGIPKLTKMAANH